MKLHCLSSNNNFFLKFFNALIMSGCSGTLGPSDLTRYCKNHRKNCKTLIREHFIGYQGSTFFNKNSSKFLSSHKLRFVIIYVWVLSQNKFLSLSQFESLSFVKFYFRHNLRFVNLSFSHLNLVAISVLSKFEFLSFVKIWVF